MAGLDDKEPIYAELYEAIAHFYGRQQLVIRAILDLGIEPDTMRGVSAWQGKADQRGIWAREWRFFFHGGGCELTHQATGEPINWEGPDPAAFSIPSFTRHLEWRLAHEATLPQLRTFVDERGQQAVMKLIDRLIADGIITPDHHLLPDADSARASAA